ncbi:MAG: DUF1273 domain-containing protein [Ruminococcaceae bacterium]|nr:DUF1273 domain-containing protein [Oscillospiraceae bacterium]
MKVTFCGNSNITGSEKVKKALDEVIRELIEQGATEFLLGGYGDFDLLCALTVKSLKKEFPHIKSIIVLPYINKTYNEELYDESEYPELEKIPPKIAILKRNEYMVDKADLLVSYVVYTYGGSFKTLRYAQKKKKAIIDLTINF